MSRKRIGLAVEQTLGHRAFFKNLQLGVAGRNDVDAVWLPIEEHPGDVFDRLPIIKGKASFKGGLRTRRALRRAHAQKRLDSALIHTQRMAHLTVDVMMRTPTVVSMDGTPYELMDYVRLAQMPDQHAGMLGRIKHAINRGTYKRAHKIISFNQVTKNSLVNHYGIAADDVLVIPPGIDTRLWQPAADKRPNDGIVRLLFVGGDLGRKGGDLLLRWARQTSRKGWELHLVTGAPAEEAPNVIFHKGLTPNNPRLVELAQRADLFVLPTRADLSPNAILEGKAAGLPSLSTKVGAIHEMVRDGVDGFLTAPGDYAALAERLDALIDKPQVLREMGLRAREMVASEFDAQKNSVRVIDVLVAAAG